MKIKTYS
ncbi:hypothetical protein VTH82DRAFT_5328 [Thermothelomyces myriococcoides]